MRPGAFGCVAAACALAACQVDDGDPDLKPTPRDPVADADPVDDAAPETANSTEDAGVVSAPDAAAYDGLYPDVADASAAPTAYVLTPDTVLDQTRHLMWQRNDPKQYFGAVPTVYCTGLGLGGFNDWRPATLAELTTLLVRQPDCPLLDHDAFPNALCDWYISSDVVNGDINNPQMLDFATGVTKSVVEVNDSQEYSTRCVRTSP